MIRHNKGFTLLEVVVAVAVVSLSALFVLRAFAQSLESMRVSRDLTLACLVGEEKMWDIRQRYRASHALLSGKDSRSMHGKDFTCAWVMERPPATNLTQISLDVSWEGNSPRKTQTINFHTILEPEAQ